MAALVIPRELANRFDLPPTCAISGAQREVEFRRLTLRHTPWWVWAIGLLFCSFGANLLALLVVAGLGGRRATIELPFAPEAHGRWRRNEAMFHAARPGHAGPGPPDPGGCLGNERWKVAPSPGGDSAHARPPCRAATMRTLGSPSPVPCLLPAAV